MICHSICWFAVVRWRNMPRSNSNIVSLCLCYKNHCDMQLWRIILIRMCSLWIFLPRCMHCIRVLATRKLSVCPSVRLSVYLSVKHVDCDRTTETCAHILIPHEKSFIWVFWQEERLVYGSDPSTWNFGKNWPCWSENAYFQSILARSASSRNA